MSEIYGVVIHDLLELGSGKKYNDLFQSFLPASDGLGNEAVGDFDKAAGKDEVLIGIDMSKEALIRPVARQADSGGTFTAVPDDQFQVRADKVGFYGFMEEGRVCIDSRALAGIVM